MQGLIRHRIAEVLEFVAERSDPDMRVIEQSCGDVGEEHLKRVRDTAFTHAGGSSAVEVAADRVAVSAGVSGNRRDRPASLS